MKTVNILFILLLVSSLFFISCSEVQPEEPESPTVSSVIVSFVPQGLGYQFWAVVSGSNNPSQRVDWAVSPITSGTFITESGLLTISPTETADTLTVTATSVVDRTKSGSEKVPVRNAGVVISPQDTTINVGEFVQFTANGVSQGYDWIVTGNQNIGTAISPLGYLMVALSETAHSLRITATSRTDYTLSGETTVWVNIPSISSVEVSPDTLRLSPGDTFTFQAVVESNITPPPAVNWSVSGGVSGTRIDSTTGLLTIATNQSATTLIITATSPAHYSPVISATATVYVWKLKDIGPGGGYIFYDRGIEYATTSDWRYLEAAPAHTEISATWGLEGVDCPGTETGIGSGKANTDIIVARLGSNGAGRAAKECDTLVVNGLTDWFLPSKGELNQMYLNICVGDNIGNFHIEPDNFTPLSWYWSSSADNDIPSGNQTWYQRFSDGHPLSDLRNIELFVRAVRRF